MAMHGVVSILDEQHYVQVESLWDTLENECGLVAIREVPIPHFSWHIARDYDIEALSPKLQTLVRELKPFEVAAEGLGIFTGYKPVLYVQVVKSPQLTALHQRVWESSQNNATDLSQLYSPDTWMPHITLANKDVDADSLACAISKLGMQEFSWKIQVDNFTIVVHEEGQVGKVHSKYPFQV